MAGRTVYGGSEMSVLLQSERVSTGNFEALLSSSSSHGLFNGSRAMLNFEKVCGSTNKEALDDEFGNCFHQSEKKRRLMTTQVQFLEKSFEVENKLEPERKIQLAKELGLQPRQIAIWFQNRRARWKTKQLEKDYESLKLSYDVLKADYENLHKEKEKLKAEVVHLTDRLLLKRKHDDRTEVLELNKPEHSTIKLKDLESNGVGTKQEDRSSTNSAVSDSESPRRADGAHADSNAYQSDVSHVEDDDEVRGYRHFLKLEDNAGNFDFPVEDHAFWLWP